MLSKADRACAVAAAVGSDFNDELTILLTGLDESLGMCEADDPMRPLLLEMRAAAQRCTWKASGLLNFAARAGVSHVRASAEDLMEESQDI
jgi:hypothetical protein